MSIGPKPGTFIRNESDDGFKPVCACGHEFEDGQIGDVKNYPEDGIVAVFFPCPKCKEESSFEYLPYWPEG